MFKFIMPAVALILLCTIIPNIALASAGFYFFTILLISFVWYHINTYQSNIFIGSLYSKEDELSDRMKEFDRNTDFLTDEGFIHTTDKFFYKFTNQKRNTLIFYDKNKNKLIIEPLLGGGEEYKYYDNNQELKVRLNGYFSLLNEMNDHFLHERGFIFEISRKSISLHRFWLLTYRFLGYSYLASYLHFLNINPLTKALLFFAYLIAENVY